MPLDDAEHGNGSIPIHGVTQSNVAEVAATLSPLGAAFVAASCFKPDVGHHVLIPGGDGALAGVLLGVDADGAKRRNPFLPGKLVGILPAGRYHFASGIDDLFLASLAWELGSYRFTRFRKKESAQPHLCVADGVDGERIKIIAASIAMGRDLVNRPANDLTPVALEEAVVGLAQTHGATLAVTRGADLLTQNFPLIHAVGRAAAEAPRLVDFTWGDPGAPKVTLVGKGVCFDTGGLDIKPGSAMLLMKKDMGGAATALALAAMVMRASLPVRLRVLIPIVENAIAGDAFRPGDVLVSRKGLSVEIGNTDAEGRLILADALALADEEAPDLLFDFATLTGAARVALGPDLPPFYTMDEDLAAEIARYAMATNDPVWRMPLWDAYDAMLESKIADINNVSGGSFAGSITAALFLRRFVEKARSWAHFDVYGWMPKAKPGHPEGGEVQAARLLFNLLDARFGHRDAADAAPAHIVEPVS